MKKLLLLFFIFWCGWSFAKDREVLRLTDTSYKVLDSGWVYTSADNIAMASKDYDDRSWKNIDPLIWFSPDTEKNFTGKAWFRNEFYTDSSLLNTPITLIISHVGASEIYIDGKLIKKFGTIKDENNSEYYQPENHPVVFTLTDTGKHVLAIRYANFNAAKNREKYNYKIAGFTARIYTAEGAHQRIDNSYNACLFFGLFFSFFLTISLVHLLLFLYYRKELSNLYFSIFALSIGLLFLYLLIQILYSNPLVMFTAQTLILTVGSLACFSLSGVINSVFPDKRKIRLYSIAAIALLVSIASFFNFSEIDICVYILVIAASLEAVVKIIIAIIQRRSGSRIIGFGFFTFALLILALMASSILLGQFEINDQTPGGKFLTLMFIISIVSIPISMSTYLAKRFALINKDLKKQLSQVQLLSEKNLEQEKEKKRLLESRKEELEIEVLARTEEVISQKEKIEKQHSELILEKKKSDDLLLNILPIEVAEELKLNGASEARYFSDVTVLFTDFVNFTKVSEQLSPQQLVSEIHAYFRAFDEITSKYGLEKIKTIGDAYLAVCGLPEPNPNHAENSVRAAIAMRAYIEERKQNGGVFEIRVGLNSGPVVAGIVGVKKFAYDIWGDTVNTAARMEQHSQAGKINISETTYELVKQLFTCTSRGKIEAKNKGMIEMYFVEDTTP